MSKCILQIIKSFSVEKTARRNTKSSKNESILEIGHYQKATAHSEYSFWVKNRNSKKLEESHFTNHLDNNRSKKHQMFEKKEHFENLPSCEGYSPCKIFLSGQKLKFQKTCQNPFYKSFRVVLCKKPFEKHQIFDR